MLFGALQLLVNCAAGAWLSASTAVYDGLLKYLATTGSSGWMTVLPAGSDGCKQARLRAAALTRLYRLPNIAWTRDAVYKTMYKIWQLSVLRINSHNIARNRITPYVRLSYTLCYACIVDNAAISRL